MIKNIKAGLITALIIAGIVLFFFMPLEAIRVVAILMMLFLVGAAVAWLFITVRDNLD